jgi:cholest-4-en-3-one 26-monooxygenase
VAEELERVLDLGHRDQGDAMELSQIDLMEDAWAADVPQEAFTTLRREAPVFWHELEGEKAPGFWAVTKHADVREVSRDVATYSSEEKGTFIADPTPEGLAAMRMTLLNMDPPKHNRYRRLVNRGFTPRMVRKIEEQVVQRAREIVDGVCERGEIDFVADVACEMPAGVICDMIGVPPEDRKQIVEWTNTMVGFDDPYWRNTPEAGELAAASIYAYCDELAEERRANPRDDIMSILVQADVDGEQLNREELDMFFVILAVAGNETTRNLISHSMRALIDHPQARDDLLADPTLWDSAVEEFLRWGTSIHNFRRTAMHDTVLNGQEIKQGDKVVVYYASANFDEDVFDDPFTLDIRRSPNDHLTFGGGGEHFCLGANLARAEIKAMLREFITRCPDVELADTPLRMRSDFINGINRMPVRFTPSKPVGAAA